MEEVEKWDEKELVDNYVNDCQKTLLDLQMYYNDILEEINKKINEQMRVKKN